MATFEAWDPAGRTFDAVIAAQSWHWVDPVAGAAKAAQVLRPGGRLAIFGHVYEPPAEVAEPFAAAYRRVVPDSPFNGQPARPSLDLYQAAYAKFADKIRETEQFDDPEQWRFEVTPILRASSHWRTAFWPGPTRPPGPRSRSWDRTLGMSESLKARDDSAEEHKSRSKPIEAVR